MSDTIFYHPKNVIRHQNRLIYFDFCLKESFSFLWVFFSLFTCHTTFANTHHSYVLHQQSLTFCVLCYAMISCVWNNYNEMSMKINKKKKTLNRILNTYLVSHFASVIRTYHLTSDSSVNTPCAIDVLIRCSVFMEMSKILLLGTLVHVFFFFQ